MMMMNQWRKKWNVLGVWWFQGEGWDENPDDAAIPTRFPPPSDCFSDLAVVVVMASDRSLPNNLSSSLILFVMLAIFKISLKPNINHLIYFQTKPVYTITWTLTSDLNPKSSEFVSPRLRSRLWSSHFFSVGFYHKIGDWSNFVFFIRLKM